MDMERGGKIFYLGSRIKDFPGGPVVKTVSSSAGGMGSIPGGETTFPCAGKKKEKENKTESFLKKLHIELPCDLAIPHLGIYPRELKMHSHKTWA